MSEWQNKSDFEINKAVAELRFNPSSIEQQGRAVHMEFDETASCNRVFDGCNNPSDAWYIIVENKISIHHDIARYSASSLVYDKKFENGFKVFNYNGEIGDISSGAALRAAMIVYLEMNGVKP